MISEVRITDPATGDKIHALAQAAYALEAERIACDKFPPLRESLAELQRCSDTFLGFRTAGVIVAVLSFVEAGKSVVITRLVVSPEHLRKGIATALLKELERRTSDGRAFVVSTAAANIPALLLYRQRGFVVSKTSISREGIFLVHLVKTNDRDS